MSENVTKELSDEELASLAQNNDEMAVNTLLKKYKSLVNQIARSYFLTGGDMEDIVQEGMIGLYKAIMHFKTPSLPHLKPLPAPASKTKSIVR